MHRHIDLSTTVVHPLIRSGQVKLAGNIKLKIYGTLRCHSGKKMKQVNRMFFRDEEEAVMSGYRPCGHCQIKEYGIWKAGLHQNFLCETQ